MDEAEFILNGFLVLQHPGGKDYEGVAGLHWPLENLGPVPIYRDPSLGIALPRPRTVEVATNWTSVHAYWQLCMENSPNTQLLLVASQFECPRVEMPSGTEWELLGYDVAYPGANFSSILSEVFGGQKILGAWLSQLNIHGLFDLLQQVEAYMQRRAALVESKALGVETVGTVIPMRLWRFAGYR